MIPFREDDENRNVVMDIGYITKKQTLRSDIAENYIANIKEFLNTAKDKELNGE